MVKKCMVSLTCSLEWYFSWWHCNGRWTTDVWDEEGSCSQSTANHLHCFKFSLLSHKKFFLQLDESSDWNDFFAAKGESFSWRLEIKGCGNTVSSCLKYKLLAVSWFHPMGWNALLPTQIWSNWAVCRELPGRMEFATSTAIPACGNRNCCLEAGIFQHIVFILHANLSNLKCFVGKNPLWEIPHFEAKN